MGTATIVRHTSEELKKMKSKTDWSRLRREQAAGVEPDMTQIEDREATDAELTAAITKRKTGRPVAATHKIPLSLRLSDDVVVFFKATGKGWQSRINEALREYVKTHRSA